MIIRHRKYTPFNRELSATGCSSWEMIGDGCFLSRDLLADNFVTDAGSGGNTYASDDVSNTHYPILKLAFGALDTVNLVSSIATNPFPVALSDTDNAVLDNIQAAVELLDDAISGNEMQVDIVASLPAGTNNIGDVDILSLIPGVGATSLGKAEDAVHSSGDTGVMVLSVRNDALATLAGTDGDYAPFQVDEVGAMWVHEAPSEVDSNNTSTSTLLAAAVFTGAGSDMLDYASVTAIIDSSHDSAVDGMQFQFSSDNSNWDVSHDFTYTAANSGRAFQFPIQAQYFRIVYTNGGTDQTSFRLQTIFHHQAPITTIHRLSDNVDPDRSAQLMKVAIIAQASGGGNFNPVQATNGGNLKVSIEEVDTSASGVGKAEDAAHSSSDVGVMALSVRQNTAASTSGADGDYQPLITDTNGRIHSNDVSTAAALSGSEFQVDVVAALPVGVNTIGDVTVSGAALTALQLIDDIVLAEDAAHSSGDPGIMALGVRNDDLATLAGTDGDYAPLQVTQNGALLSCLSANDDYRFVIIDAATSGNNTIQAAAGAGVQIRVLSAFLVSAGTVNARFESGANGTALTGQMNLVANSGFTLPYNPAGWFETGANVLLNLELSAAVSVDGCITFIEVA